MQLFPDFGSSKLAVNAANSASAAAASAAQAAVSANNAAVQGIISSTVTLSAGSTAAVSVTLSNNDLLAVSTSLRGILSTIIGILERSAGGSYTFTPATPPLATITIPTGSLFVASATPENLNPINIDGHVLSRDSIYTEFGYASVMLDNTNRLAWGTLTNGTLFANKPAQMSITGNSATATTATTAVTAISAITATSADTASSATTAASATTATTASSALSLTLPNGTTIYNDSSIDEFYNSVFLDSQNRISWGVLLDGSLFASKPAQMSITGNAATATTATTSTTATTAQSLTLPGGTTIFRDPVFSEFYSSVFVDSQNRISWGVLLDGSLFASKPAQMSITGNAATAATATTATTATTAVSVAFSNGDTTAADQAYADTIEWAVVDSNNRIALGIKRNGRLVIPLVQPYVTFGQVHTEAGLYSVTVDTFGKSQIQRGADAVTTLTSNGNNWDPVTTAETPQRIAFQSDRTDGIQYWVMNADGTRQARATPSINDITFWGDSMTQRLQTYNHLPGLLSGRTITYNALGGTSVEHIIARQDGERATCTIPSGSIPANGSVSLRNVFPSLGYHAGTTTVGATYSFLVTIAGVQGTLTSTTNASSQADYTFTRSSSGSAVTITGPVEIIVLSNITQGSFGFSKSNTAVFWMGTNPLSALPSTSYDPTAGTGIYFKSPATTYDPTNISAVQARTIAITQNLINRIENLDRHVLIMGPFIGQGQVWSSSTEKLAMVAGFSTFSKHWYDLRSDFIATCKTWLQTNHPSIYANWTAADDTNVANGASPAIMREDTIHLNTYGTQLVSQLIATKLSSKNW